MKREIFKSRFSLIMLGIALGWIARIVLGAPPQEMEPPRTIDRPIEAISEEVDDVSNHYSDDEPTEWETGLVPPIKLPPIKLPGTYSILKSPGQSGNLFAQHSQLLLDEFSHDESASFEAHGEQLCASGCAISRHPTATLTKSRFEQLLAGLANSPMEDTNTALEELVYFGAQTRKLIQSHGFGELDSRRASFLWDQLTYTHARISIRVKDDQGVIRTWIEPTRVPFDRRHVFEMKTNNVQPLVTSGTIKRVGLNHIWTRL